MTAGAEMEVEVELPDDSGLSCRRKHSRNRPVDGNPDDTWAQSGDFEKASRSICHRVTITTLETRRLRGQIYVFYEIERA